jgi:hypothetical protein
MHAPFLSLANLARGSVPCWIVTVQYKGKAMRTIAVLFGSLAVITLATPAMSDDDKSRNPGGGQGRPERTLECHAAQPGGCDVSCVSTSGTVLFVHGGVVRAYITEFAGNHTLLELQKAVAGDIISVLVGDISHCSLNGLRDAALT